MFRVKIPKNDTPSAMKDAKQEAPTPGFGQPLEEFQNKSRLGAKMQEMFKAGKFKKQLRDSKEKTSTVSTPSSFIAGEKEPNTDDLRHILNQNMAKRDS